MKPNDNKRQARIVVSEQLRLFFSHLKGRLASTTDDLWKRVEAKLNRDKRN